ncbi:FecR family protein [Longitalea luteola]|uniref:FecR family protein n=1 Tax=Longitalea luteola TaxID=2812563 RepID=UPI001A977F96|nr:FecR family protein [Longitalea luteola]
MQDNSLINEILLKVIRGEELSSVESSNLQEWLTDAEKRRLLDDLRDTDYLREKLKEAAEVDVAGAKDLFFQRLAIGERNSIKRQWQWKLFRDVATKAAAVLVLAAASFFWFYNRKQGGDTVTKGKAQQAEIIIANDVAPGQTKASLTLANGKTVVLDSTVVGQVAQEGGIVVVNTRRGLTYQKNSDEQNDVLYNTLSTKNGETYSAVLADGSKVWLNTGASIRYPVTFTGSERKVEITGEVYFEVAHDESKPFFVHTTTAQGEGMDVQVLGTHFNIRAYQDEAGIKTTLLEGSVKLIQNNKETLLKPGQQAQVNNGNIKVIGDVNAEAVIAWKNGFFHFDHASITEVMRELQKWYNIEAVYAGAKPTAPIIGDINRNLMLSEVAKMLELSADLHLRIEGKKLIVQ